MEMGGATVQIILQPASQPAGALDLLWLHFFEMLMCHPCFFYSQWEKQCLYTHISVCVCLVWCHSSLTCFSIFISIRARETLSEQRWAPGYFCPAVPLPLPTPWRSLQARIRAHHCWESVPRTQVRHNCSNELLGRLPHSAASSATRRQNKSCHN